MSPKAPGGSSASPKNYAWNGRSNAGSSNPRLYFKYPGTYTVRLIASNSYGIDSLTRTLYINVRQLSTMCQIPWGTDFSSGILYDDGGADGVYSPGKNGLKRCTYSISPCKGTINLEVSQFDLGKDDYLKVYDGNTERGRPLWDVLTYPNGMTGDINDLSIPSSLKAVSGAVYFVFESDNDVATIGDGFAIKWDANLMVPWSSPLALIDLPDTACIGYAATFQNKSIGGWSHIEWDLGDNGSIDGTTDVFEHVFKTGGYHHIKLSAIGPCASNDSLLDSVFVQAPARVPSPRFSASTTVVNAGDTVYLNDLTNYCSDSTLWEISPDGYHLIDEGQETDDNLGVVFEKAGVYDLKLTKGNIIGNTSKTKTSYIKVLRYCIPNVLNPSDDLGISKVKFADIDNRSAMVETAYSDYLNVSTEVEVGHTYTLTMERSKGSRQMSRSAWIDWNIDGDFDDIGEWVASESASSTSSFTAYVTVPSTLSVVKTRLRVATSFNKHKNKACGPHAFGEFEDYTVFITPDQTPPVIRLFGLLTEEIEVGSLWKEPGYKALDLVDGNLTSTVITLTTLNKNVIGSYSINYRVTDKNGNTVVVTRNVKVVDSTLPTVELNGKDTVRVQLFGPYTERGVTVRDNHDLLINPEIKSDFDLDKVGEYKIGYCATDAQGNGPVCVDRVVIVVDTIIPEIKLLGSNPEALEVFSQYHDVGIAITENGPYTTITSGSWTGSTSVLGTYQLTYTVVDSGRNQASVTRRIEVIDTESSVISLNGNAVEFVGRWSEYVDAGYTVSDNYYGIDELTLVRGGDYVDTQSDGIYTITYEAKDPSGNTSSTITRVLVVEQDMILGLSELEVNGLAVYPNPSTGQVNIGANLSDVELVVIHVVDALGKVRTTNSVALGDGRVVTMDLSGIGPGAYFIEVSGAGFHAIKPIHVTK